MGAPDPVDERKALMRLLAARLGGTVLLLAGIAIALLTPAIWLGFALVVAAVVLRLVLNRTIRQQVRAVRAAQGELWWFNHRTGEVEKGHGTLDSGRDGPYATREDAQRSREIARERAAQWNAED